MKIAFEKSAAKQIDPQASFNLGLIFFILNSTSFHPGRSLFMQASLSVLMWRKSWRKFACFRFHCCHCCIETPRPLSNFIWLNLSRFEEGDRFNEPPLCCPHTSTTSTTNPLVQVKEDHDDHCGWCRRHGRRATDAKTVWRRGRLCVLSPLSGVVICTCTSIAVCKRGAVRIVWGLQSLQ